MPLKIVKGKDESGLTLHSTYMGEICSECGKARMLHPQVYVYTCPHCRFSYQVNPVSNTFSRDITILNKGEVRKQRKKRH